MLSSAAHLVWNKLTRLITLPLLLALVAAGALTFVAQQSATPSPAEAASYAKAGRGAGYTFKGQWFGSWTTRGSRGFCIDFDRSDPTSRGRHHLNGRVPGMNTEDSARVKYIVNTYGETRDKTTGAAVAIFVWKTQKTQRFDRYYAKLLKAKAVPAKVRDRERQIAAEAKLHGPFRIVIKQGSGLPGQQFTGTARVTTKTGNHALAGARLTLSTTNSTLVKRGSRTGRSGVISFTSRVAGPGQVSTTAALSMPSATASWISEPSAGHQRLVVAGNGRQSVSARAASVRSLNGPTLVNACTGDCHGAAPVRVTMKNTSGMTVREFVYGNGIKKGSFDVAPGATVTKTMTMADAVRVTTKYCYLTKAKACAGALVATGSTLTVVCPVWVEYTYQGTCPCDPGKNLRYSVSVPASPRTYQVRLVTTPMNGQPGTQTRDLKGGQSADFAPVRFAKGTRVTLSFTVLGRTHLLDDLTQNM